MKIDGAYPVGGAGDSSGKEKVDKVEGSSFHEILKSVSGDGAKGLGSKNVKGAFALPENPIITPYNSSDKSSAPLIADSVDNILTDLEMFKNLLGNSDVPVERLNDFMREISVKKDAIVDGANLAGDDDLKSLASDLASVVNESISQFYSGYGA